MRRAVPPPASSDHKPPGVLRRGVAPGNQQKKKPAPVAAETGRANPLHEGYDMNFGNHRGAVSARHTFTRGGTVIAGKQWKFTFPNGFGASVINDGYGRESGLYELAVLGPDGHITYDTPLTDAILGFLTEADVANALDRIEALSADAVAAEIARRADKERDAKIAALRAELAALEAEAGAK